MAKKEQKFQPPLRNPGAGRASAADLPDCLDEAYGEIERLLFDIRETAKAKEAITGSGGKEFDTYGCDRVFLQGFINDRMEDDFPLIAREFLYREAGSFSKQGDIQYVDFDSGDLWPEEAFNLFILNLMMNAYRSGSEYARSLFVYLHKTYYRKEYKSLKRFSSLSADELVALAKPGREECGYGFVDNMARILFIAEAYGIRIGEDCRLTYGFFNDCAARENHPDRFSFSEKVGDTFQDCLKEIEEGGDLDEYYALDEKVSKFLGNAFRWLGYDPEYADQCDDNNRGFTRQLATALAILKKTFPGKKFTPKEIVGCSVIVHVASALTCNEDWLAEQMKMLAYGKEGTDFYDEFPEVFHPEEVTGSLTAQPVRKDGEGEEKTPVPKVMQGSDAKGVPDKDYEEAMRRIRCLEQENQELRTQLSGRHALEKENRDLTEKTDAMTRELSALRSHVYHLTEEDIPVGEMKMEEMREELSGRRVVIVGGHANWVSKMRKAFPDWKYVNPEVSGSLDATIVEGADHVYFFSDILSHSTYSRYVSVAREKKVGFGYIHGVNLEKNICQMYRELCTDESG